MDQEIRNKLRSVVTHCRRLLEDAVSQELEGKYSIFARREQVTADQNAILTHLTEEEQAARRDILDHLAHVEARGFKPREALEHLVREIAFTHLNRLCAYKMMEAREVYVGGQRFREAVSRGVNSNGVKFYLADHPEEERLFNTGHQDLAYRHFLDWLGALLSDEIGVLFNPNDPANRLYPRQKTLDQVLDLLNGGGIKPEEAELREEWPQIWSQDETIGWVYQYFTPKELRDAARDPKKGGSQAPRNSYELAFRNQFFTPRYVVEFLADNTLGRIWYEMRKGNTELKDQCRYMVRHPAEIFLKEGEQSPKDADRGRDDRSQEELLKLPVHISHRPKKDPRELKILDPACGSGHFLLYCFDLLFTIYEESFADPDLGPALQKDYATLEDLRRGVPRLILAHNLHGIDIDERASQIAALALWLRCQRAYQQMGLKNNRARITRSNFVSAEPMPGEKQILQEFVGQLEPRLLGQLVEVVFDKMRLAGEAGSLLKIEEDIRDATVRAKEQWLAGPVSLQQSLFDDRAPERQQAFDLTGITDAQFFEQAETKVVEALRRYAETAQNSHKLQRRLFTDDAVRGFAFVDLSHKRYDVILMNPPFGQPADASRSLLDEEYSEVKVDIAIAFVSRALDMLHDSGKVGVIATRTCLFLNNLEEWRRKRLSATSLLECLADLGYGVLHGAMVEAAAFTIGTTPSADRHTARAAFISALRTDRKDACVLNAITKFRNAHLDETVHIERLAGFDILPRTPFAYWISERTRRSIASLGSFRKGRREAQEGLSTKNDDRFLRAVWEVPISLLGKGRRWHYIGKGGEYSPYYDDIHLVVDWADDGKVLEQSIIDKYPYLNGNAGWVLHPGGRYFEPGLTFPLRTTSDYSPRVLPAGCRFSLGGQGIFFENSRFGLFYLAIAYSRIYKMLIEIFIGSGDSSVSGTAARNYVSGVVNDIPFEYPESTLLEGVIETAEAVARRFKNVWTADETSRIFRRCVAVGSDTSLDECAASSYRRFEDDLLFILNASHHAEIASQKTYNLTDAEFDELDKIVAPHPLSYAAKPSEDLADIGRLYQQGIDTIVDELCERRGPTRHYTKKAYFADRRLELISHLLEAHPASIVTARRERNVLPSGLVNNVTADLLSYCLGVAFGRWDIRCALSEIGLNADDEAVFAELQACPPGMLRSSEGGPATEGPDGYPLACAYDGVIPDDADNQDDVGRRVRQVLEIIWKDRAEAIEKEACKVIGVKELRDYFRRTGKGSFWDDHVSRYSKSRRKAPIYWLLQSSHKNFGLWLYYHRLDKDLLFKALVNYVEPKMRLETSRLETIRNRKAAAGESGRDAKRLAKEVERQEDLISELRDFEDKLRRAANLHLEPDLNDGVILNVALLQELVPWKEAKDCWEDLLAGRYEWSSIGKQLRQRELVKS
jgi:hypothetical protein